MSEETKVTYPKFMPLKAVRPYDPNNITLAQETAQKIWARFGCLQDGISELQFILKAGDIIERQYYDTEERLDAALASWDEERERALRESVRVTHLIMELNLACNLLSEAHSFVSNMPIADVMGDFIASHQRPVFVPDKLPANPINSASLG